MPGAYAQVPIPRCLRTRLRCPQKNLKMYVLRAKGCLDFHLKLHNHHSTSWTTTISAQKNNVWRPRAGLICMYIFLYIYIYGLWPVDGVPTLVALLGVQRTSSVLVPGLRVESTWKSIVFPGQPIQVCIYIYIGCHHHILKKTCTVQDMRGHRQY